MEDGSTLNRLDGCSSIGTVKPVLLVLTIHIFLTVTLLAGILAFVAELVLLGILKLLVEFLAFASALLRLPRSSCNSGHRDRPVSCSKVPAIQLIRVLVLI